MLNNVPYRDPSCECADLDKCDLLLLHGTPCGYAFRRLDIVQGQTNTE